MIMGGFWNFSFQLSNPHLTVLNYTVVAGQQWHSVAPGPQIKTSEKFAKSGISCGKYFSVL